MHREPLQGLEQESSLQLLLEALQKSGWVAASWNPSGGGSRGEKCAQVRRMVEGTLGGDKVG